MAIYMANEPDVQEAIEAPEFRLAMLCRELMGECNFLTTISFRVERDDGEYQTYSIGRRVDDPEAA